VEAAWSAADTEVFARYGDAFVPHRRAQIDIVCRLLADIPVPRVLDLCCGEGLLSEEYLRRQPDAEVLLFDGSADMLAAAERRLERFRPRFSAVQADIADRGWRSATRFGGVMTSLAVHHLDGAGKRELYRDLCSMLEPGGMFVMADLIEPAGPLAKNLAADEWDSAVRSASRELYGSDEAAEVFEREEWNYFRLPGPDPLDRPSSVAEHLTWLAEAGFVEVDVVWLYAGHAVFTARKP
jgi:tRNA (cmo5U34)-methyltransferase